MKILYVTTVSGTINSFLVPHIEMLLDLGHQVDIACRISRPINKILLDRGCRVFDMEFQRSPFKKKNFKAYRTLKKLVLNQKYDLVHTHTPVASAITRLACKNIKETKVEKNNIKYEQIYLAIGIRCFTNLAICPTNT